MKFGTGKVDRNGNRRKKFGIIGFAESSRHLAPYDDDSWEIGAMNQLYRHIPRADIWFECHKRNDFLSDQVPGTDYLAWLRNCPIPIMMLDEAADITSSVRMPIESWVESYGNYFYSTISYMLAYALDGKYEEIGIWGVDLAHDSEYEYQKPSAEYLLGIAKGRGVKITIAPQSALLKGLYQYGYDPLPSNDDIQWLDVYKGRVTAKLQETLGVANQLQGQVNCAEEFLMWARSKRRGSAPPPTDQPDPDKIATD